MEATFDTGTAKNWLSEGAVAQLKYRIEEVQPVLYSTFTGQTVECSKIIRDVKLCIATKQGSGNKSTWTDFRVAPPNAPFEVLFGREFIHAEEIFNFKEAALILVKSEEAAGGSSRALASYTR